jgi:phage terminase large subunit
MSHSVNEISVGSLYSKIAECKSKYIILQGGKWSSKTVNTLVHLGLLAVKSKVIITVVGSTIPNLKKGALRDFQNHVACKDGIKERIESYNSSERTYHFTNGSILEFTSYTTALEATSGKRDYAFFNEVPGILFDIFYNCSISTALQVFMDYNPVAPFFVHSKFINSKPGDQYYGKFTRFITDHRHNPFLSQDKHDEIESISDPEKFRVYARGLTGKVEGTIFNFTKIDKIPEGLPFGFGLDFGYNSDKTSIVKVSWQGRNRYYEELYYKVGVDTDEIAGVLKTNGCTTSSLVWGDHDKNASVYLRRQDIPFRMARKGPNSLTASISKVNEFNNFYTGGNLEEELKTYIWEQGIDLLTGNEVSLNVPVDGMEDHSIAALRYFIYSHSLRFVE